MEEIKKWLKRGQRVKATRSIYGGKVKEGDRGVIYLSSDSSTAFVDWDNLYSGHSGTGYGNNDKGGRHNHCWNVPVDCIEFIEEDWDS